jgi:hypothetical protein
MFGKSCFRLGYLCFLLPFALGCGGVGKTKVYGKVSLDGKPLKNGSVTFVGLELKSRVAGGAIKNGEYIVNDVAPGMNVIHVRSTITPYDPDNLGAPPAMSGKMMGGDVFQGVDVKGIPPDPQKIKQAILASRGVTIVVDDDTIGNHQTHTIGTGSMELSIALQTPAKK